MLISPNLAVVWCVNPPANIPRFAEQHHRKLKKEANRAAASGKPITTTRKKKDPGIPNAWPFKEDLLKEIERSVARPRCSHGRALSHLPSWTTAFRFLWVQG